MNPICAMAKNRPIDKEYSMPPEEYRKLLLKNNIIYDTNINTTVFGQQRQNPKITVDPETQYSLNNFGYRDIDWFEKTEILALGCSNTFGFGVTVEGRWTNILSKKINKEIRNLSFPGASILELVSKSFEYFKIFGNPTVMICLFPDPFRTWMPHKKGLNNGDYNYQGKEEVNPFEPDLYLSTVFFDYSSDKKVQKEKYFKTPYSYEKVLPAELSIFNSMQAIHMLEQYCKSSNIKLIWTTWHRPTHNLLNSDEENIFNSFIFDENLIISHDLADGFEKFNEGCHEEYRHEFAKYFDMGLDIEDGLNYAHPGVHKHIHFAEAFYEAMNK
jgi:hypothetical protein